MNDATGHFIGLKKSETGFSIRVADPDLDKQGTTEMAPIRLRHAKGVSTIEVLSDSTVQDLQQEIYAQTQILPSRQIRLFLKFIHSNSLST